MSIRKNIELIKEKIAKAAENSANRVSDIIVVCVSKNRSLDEIYQVLDLGLTYIGESKVQEAESKFDSIRSYAQSKNIALNFHMVGHLQTNKVNKALNLFNLIHF